MLPVSNPVFKAAFMSLLLAAIFLNGIPTGKDFEPLTALADTKAKDTSSADFEILNHQTRFSVQLGSLVLGKATFNYKIDDKNYQLNATGKTDGIAKWFSSGKAIIKSAGQYDARGVLPSNHFVSITEGKKKVTLDMKIKDGSVASAIRTPPKKKKKKKSHIRVLPAHLNNIIDPASSLLVPVAYENATDPKAVCDRTLPVYDGDTRYNMKLSYKTNKKIKTKGYNGYAYVCRLEYVPIAGHNSDHANVKRMAKNKKMEIWLAPISATNIFTAIRIYVPTWLGTFTAEPEYFGSL